MSSMLIKDFDVNLIKSRNLHQYKCCRHVWWGGTTNNTCKDCKEEVEKLPLNKMIGIGWFECVCGRRYAGFSRGDVSSKCHGCEVENFAAFIIPGDKANKDEKTDKSHYCNACKGANDCPIVAQANRSSNDKNKFRRKPRR